MVNDSLLNDCAFDCVDIEKEAEELTQSLPLSRAQVLISDEIGGNVVHHTFLLVPAIALIQLDHHLDKVVPVFGIALTERPDWCHAMSPCGEQIDV